MQAAPFILAATAAIGSGVSAYSSYQQGEAQQSAFAAEARSRELEAKQADLQARQISALRLQELNANLGAIEAARAGKNLAGDSPTGVALTRSFTRESMTARASEVMDARLRQLGALNARQSALAQGKAARLAGTLGAVGDTADMVSRLGRLSPRRTPTSTRRNG